MTLAITSDEVALSLDVRIRPRDPHRGQDRTAPPDLDPACIGLLPGDSGTVAGAGLAGRRFERVAVAAG
jgi:hypothetical protein